MSAKNKTGSRLRDPVEGDVYRHPSAGEEVIIDYVTDAEVYLRVTDGAGGLIRACRVPRTSWKAIREVHGLQLTNREEP